MYKNVFDNFPSKNLWRLFIDFNYQQKKGPLGFDIEEPGFLISMFYAFDWMLSTLNTQLSITYLVDLHTKAIQFLQGFDKEIRCINSPKSEGAVWFGLNKANATLNGLRELLKKIEADEGFRIKLYDRVNKHYIIEINNKNCNNEDIKEEYNANKIYDKTDYGPDRMFYLLPPVADIKDRLNKIISNYNKEIEQANTEEKKIHAIATCIHEIEITHPFYDGNSRTMVILLYKLLIQQGLKPTVLTNPCYLDAYSIDEICKEIEKGRKNFVTCEHSEPYNHALCELSYENHPQIYQEITSEIVQKAIGEHFSIKDETTQAPLFNADDDDDADDKTTQAPVVACNSR